MFSTRPLDVRRMIVEIFDHAFGWRSVGSSPLRASADAAPFLHAAERGGVGIVRVERQEHDFIERSGSFQCHLGLRRWWDASNAWRPPRLDQCRGKRAEQAHALALGERGDGRAAADLRVAAPITGTERREEIIFAMGVRGGRAGRAGIMSGSRKRLSRNGSTASSESGPPSWNSTMPTRFFPATLFAPMQRIFEALDIFVQRGGAAGYGEVVGEENSPRDEIRRKNTVQIFHTASDSCRRVSSAPRADSIMVAGANQ